MRYRVVVAMHCIYVVEADSSDEAEEIVARMTPAEAEDIEIIETTTVEVQ